VALKAVLQIDQAAVSDLVCAANRVAAVPSEHVLVVVIVVVAITVIAAVIYISRSAHDWLRLERARELLAIHRRPLLFTVVTAVAVAGILIALIRFDKAGEVISRVEQANPELLMLAVLFEVLSFAGYVALARAAFSPQEERIQWRESAEITLAGVVATRLLATGGVGGIALTAWALRAAGMDARATAQRLTGFLVALYSVFFVTLFLVGVGLATRLLWGAPRGLAVLGALVGGAVIALALAVFIAPENMERRARRAAQGGGHAGRLAGRLSTVPAVAHEGTKVALGIMRGGWSAPVGAVAWWAFDVAVLGVTFETFGAAPALGVIVLCYFLGQLANVIPVPGGVGPVEGGMIACFAACGVPVDLAVVAVLSYQAISTWLPAAPGAYGYWRLRRTVAAWRLSDQKAQG
jgi:uncharacterized membrane protein YbhN (UPF0104 family)